MTQAATREFEKHGRSTCKAEFTARMGSLMPWAEIHTFIEPRYPKAGNGRPPVGLARMLRMSFAANRSIPLAFTSAIMLMASPFVVLRKSKNSVMALDADSGLHRSLWTRKSLSFVERPLSLSSHLRFGAIGGDEAGIGPQRVMLGLHDHAPMARPGAGPIAE